MAISIDPKTVRGVFLDNDQGHLDRMKETYKKMQMIKIPDSGHAPQVPFEGGGEFARVFQSELKAGNLYCEALISLGYKEDRYDERAGIWADHITRLFTYLDTLMDFYPDQPLYVLLDWDRTLTVVEGYRDLYIEGAEEAIYEDMLKYLFGGAKRLAMIREMLDTLSKYKNINIWILTNNTGCGTSEFTKLVERLKDNNADRIHATICAWLTSGGNKTNALTSEMVRIRSGSESASASSSNSASASASSSASSYGGSRTCGSRKTRKRHGLGRSRTRGRYHLRKSKKRRAVRTIRR